MVEMSASKYQHFESHIFNSSSWYGTQSVHSLIKSKVYFALALSSKSIYQNAISLNFLFLFRYQDGDNKINSFSNAR